MMEQKRYHIVIASIIFAVLAWVSVNLREEYTVVKHFPIVLENLKHGKALKYPFPKTINVRFKGNGWALAGLYIVPDLVYTIDLATLGSDDFMITAQDLQEHIKFPMSLQPFDVDPDTMLLALDVYREKHVPITLNSTMSFKSGYGQVGSLRVIPESVVIGGSKHIIESIISWPTLYRKFDELKAPVNADVLLEEPSNHSVRLLCSSVRIQVDVQPFAEKAFTGIQLIAASVPANREIIFIPPKIDVVVRGGIDQLARLSNNDFQAVVNYQDLTADSSETIRPSLVVPPDVKVVNKKPEKFQYIIRKKL
jgi:hypothetical protein